MIQAGEVIHNSHGNEVLVTKVTPGHYGLLIEGYFLTSPTEPFQVYTVESPIPETPHPVEVLNHRITVLGLTWLVWEEKKIPCVTVAVPEVLRVLSPPSIQYTEALIEEWRHLNEKMVTQPTGNQGP